MAESWTHDFRVRSFSDSTSFDVNDGDEITITLQPNTQSLIEVISKEFVDPGPIIGVLWQAYGPTSSFNIQNLDALTYDDTGELHPGQVFNFQSSTDTAGVFQFVIRMFWAPKTIRFFRLKVIVPSYAIGAVALPGLAQDLIDLRWELRTGQLRSSYLDGLSTGLKMGADLRFAVILTLGGVPATEEVTKLELGIRPPNLFIEPPFALAAVEDTPIDPVSVGDTDYYLLEFNLSSEPLQAWFDELNNAATITPETVRLVSAMAELRVTYDGKVFVSDTINLPLLQSVIGLTA